MRICDVLYLAEYNDIYVFSSFLIHYRYAAVCSVICYCYWHMLYCNLGMVEYILHAIVAHI